MDPGMRPSLAVDLPDHDWHFVRALAFDVVDDALRGGRATAQFHGVVISAVRPSPRSRAVWLSVRRGGEQWSVMISPAAPVEAATAFLPAPIGGVAPLW
jgi:hypothetical protein